MYPPWSIPTPALFTAPAEEPVTPAELLLHLRMDHLDAADPERDLITSLGVAARQWFEAALDRQLVTATWTITLPFFPSWAIELPYPPLASVTSIVYKDVALTSRTLATTVYDVVTTVTPGYVAPKDGQAWPGTGVSPSAVVIKYVSGYGGASSVPDLVKAGIKLLVGHWYMNREAVAAQGTTMAPVPMAIESIAAACRAYRF